MAKLALLIGVSEYESGLNPLMGAVKDIEAMQRVLQDAEMGGFNQVKTLSNPDPMVMQEAIETLFANCSREDLALLFFSGHGVKDDSGRLYFATRATRKTPKGELVRATAVPASFVQDIMGNSRCKRQIVILDCCFSGAFAEGMMAKDDGSVDVSTQLGGEGRAVLTSSTSTQYSFEQQGADLSIYTRYFVEGIETGAADLDQDGVISIDELHEYTRKKVQEAAPAMKPKIYAVEEGFKIHLAQAPTTDPQLSYRREVERVASQGEISPIGRFTLDAYREELALPLEVAYTIEAEVLKPYQEYQRKLQQYKQAYQQAVAREKSLSSSTRGELKRLQKVLGLRDEDIAPRSHQPLLARMNQLSNRAVQGSTSGYKPQTETSSNAPPASRINTKLVALAGVALTTVLVGLSAFFSDLNSQSGSPPATTASSPAASSQISSGHLITKGNEKFDKGDMQGAIADYTQAIEINQNWDSFDSDYFGLPTAYNNRGLAYYNQDKYTEAIADYNQASQLKPDYTDAYYNRGSAYFDQGKYTEAIADYNQASQLKPDYTDAYYSRGLVYKNMGDKAKAIADFQKATNLYQKQNNTTWYQKAQDQLQRLQQ